MASTKNASFDPALVTQTVNFHGPNLLKLLVGQTECKTQILHSINLKAIDYKVYQERSIEIRNAGNRCNELVEFIASKSAILLTSQANQENCIKDNDHEDLSYKDRYAHQIPIEYLMQVSKSVRASNALNNHLKRGSIICVAVHSSQATMAPKIVYSLKFLCYDNGKYGYFTDFDYSTLMIGMSHSDTIVPSADQDIALRWMVGTRLRVEVLEICEKGVINILVGTRGVTIPEDKKTSIQLGKVRLIDLPPIVSVAPDPTIHYISDCIVKMDSFKNPQSNKFMASQLNIDLHSYPSLMSSLRGKYPENETASSLRKAQLCKWAHKSVADGVTHFKKKEHEEAFQCLNKALQIDKENVEALVAKGALLANLGRYQKAVEEFETALKYNPDHQNARKYMCETLVELGKQQEEKENLLDAEKSYLRCLELNADHEVAQTAIKGISRKLGKNNNIFLNKVDSPEKDLLSDLLEMEAEFKKKQEEKKNNVLGEETTVQKQDPSSPEKKGLKITIIKDALEIESEKVAEVVEPAPLSPLSQKLAMQQNMWPPNYNSQNAIETLGSHNNNNRPINNQGFNQIPIFTQPPPYNMFSNPPPGWPNFAVAPPVIPPKDTSVDLSYNDKVDEFLKRLEARSSLRGRRKKSRSSSREKRSKSRERSRSKKRSRHKDQKKKMSSRRRSSDSSSTTSTSSSSSSRSSSSDSDRKVSRRRKRSKKVKKSKDSSKKSPELKPSENKPKVSDLTIPDFDVLEEKLNAYYRKMESINEPEEESDQSPKIKKDKHSSKKKYEDHSSKRKSYERSSNKKSNERSSNKKLDEYSREKPDEHSSKKKSDEHSSKKKSDEYSSKKKSDKYSSNKRSDEHSSNKSDSDEHESRSNKKSDKYSSNKRSVERSSNRSDSDEHERRSNKKSDKYSSNKKSDEHSSNMSDSDEHESRSNKKLDKYSSKNKSDEHSSNMSDSDEHESRSNKKSDKYSSKKRSDERSSSKKLEEHSSNKKLDEHSRKKKLDEHSSNKKTHESESDLEDKEGSKTKPHSKEDATITPKSRTVELNTKRKFNVHPAFLEDESDEEDEEIMVTQKILSDLVAKKPDSHTKSISKLEDIMVTQKILRDIEAKKPDKVNIRPTDKILKKISNKDSRKAKSSSPQSSSSRSSSQSSSGTYNKRKRRKRSHSNSRSKKSRPYNKKTRSRSRNRHSRSHSRSKSRNSHSRSKSRNRHSRSKSRNRQSRSNNRQSRSRIRHSRSRSRNRHLRSNSRNSLSSSSSSNRNSRSSSRNRHSRSRSKGRHSTLKKHSQLKSSDLRSTHKKHSRSKSNDKSSQKQKSKEISSRYSSSPTYTPGSKSSKSKFRSKSKECEKVEIIKDKIMTIENKPKEPSPKFGYYQNRPFFSFKPKTPINVSLPGKISVPPASLNHPLPQPSSSFNPKKMEKFQESKQLINKYLGLSNTKTEGKTKPSFAPISIVHPQRFGKWLNNDEPSKPQETKGPTLDEYEKFLQQAKEKKLEQMKERNKAFLKPAF